MERGADLFATRTKERAAELRGRSPGRVLLVGGGEIGLELALAFRRTLWKASFLDVDTRGPASWLVRDRESGLFDGVEVTPDAWNVVSEGTDLSRISTSISSFLNQLQPRFVILEDYFTGPDAWDRAERFNTREPNSPRFLPTNRAPNGGVATSQLLSRSTSLREFRRRLGRIIGPECEIIGAEVDLENAEAAIRQHLASKGPIVVKADTTSCAHGMTFVDDATRVEEAGERLRSARVPAKSFVVEPRIKPPPDEAFTIVYATDSGYSVVGPIEFRCEMRSHFGPMRLAYARFPPEDRAHDARDALVTLSKRIAENLQAPYLALEFLLPGDRVVLNEVSWRPDAPGMVTLLSHEPDQFRLFRDILEQGNAPPVGAREGVFITKPILRSDRWGRFPTSASYLVEDHAVVHFYNKGRPSDPAKAERVYGYYSLDITGDEGVAEFEERLRLRCRRLLLTSGQADPRFPKGPE